MKRLLFTFLLFFTLTESVTAQVFAYKRQNKWQIALSHRIGLALNYNGVDGPDTKSVASFLNWNTQLDVDAGYRSSTFLWGNWLTLKYQQSHSNDKLPIKGPSIFDFTTRPVQKLFTTASSSVDASFEGRIWTTFLPETNQEGETTSEFFNPAFISEGLYLHRQDTIGVNNTFTINIQLGYAFLQTTYRDKAPLSPMLPESFATSAANGPASTFSFVYTPVPIEDAQFHKVVSFNMSLILRMFKRSGISGELSKARVEGALTTSLTIGDLVEIVNSINLEYDSAIGKRRKLSTSVSINLHYNVNFGG